jgi:uncharacterized protein
MIFVDTNVFMYAVGRPHPLRDSAREALREAPGGSFSMATSAEVLPELFHAYVPEAGAPPLTPRSDLQTILPRYGP